MLRSLCFLLVLAVLAVGGGLAFAAAASQAAIGPPLAARASASASASAAAAPSGSDGGSAIDAARRIGDIIKAWGSALLLGIAGLAGIGVLATRSVAAALTLLVIVVIVGGFVYAGDSVKGLIESIWQPIAGG